MKSFIFFLALFCELTLSAQAQYTVKGFVHNASLEGIPRVAIKVLDADTNLIVSEPLTGTNGLFSFTSPPRKLRIYIESTGDYLCRIGGICDRTQNSNCNTVLRRVFCVWVTIISWGITQWITAVSAYKMACAMKVLPIFSTPNVGTARAICLT